jgi:class 3 adenylate cyclase
MQCPTCAREIPEQSRYCLHCGSDLGDVTSPGRPRIDGFSLIRNYIPRDLADRILNAGRQIESERRLVTILFVDVTGFTALSEKLDPEVVTSVLNDCFTGLISTILRYEGTIDKFIGDGIMAIFGAPHAHENDTERAVRCALDMAADLERFNRRRAGDLPDPLGLHIGLHSGMVVAGNVGNDVRMNYSVIGDTVNLASRLVEIAPRGEIYLSSETFKLVAPVIAAEGPFEMHIRGKSAAVFVYRLVALHGNGKRQREIDSAEEMMGRGSQIMILDRELDRVLLKHSVRLIIRGEAGIGKSRLTAELLHAARSKQIATITGWCSSFETATPYFLWSTVLRDLTRIPADADEPSIRSQLSHWLSQFSLTDHEPYLATLLSVRYESIMFVDDHLRKQRIFHGVRALIRAVAQHQPTCFVFEDLHWIDPLSRELLEEVVVPAFDAIPGMLALTFRDDFSHARLLAHTGTVLDLNPLDRQSARSLMMRHLSADSIPPALEELLMQRSEGNPRFLKDIIAFLLEEKKIEVRHQRVETVPENLDVPVPSSIQTMIMARVDRLQDSVKEVLFAASAIGRDFPRAVLEQIVGQKQDLNAALLELRAAELIVERPGLRGAAFSFKHHLIHEVAYKTMLINKRKELHLAIAGAIEQIHKDDIEGHFETLAGHYEKAELWDRAAEYLSRSTSRARQPYTREESEGFFARKPMTVRRLYHSPAAEPGFWSRLRGMLPPLLATVFLILLMSYLGAVYFYGHLTSAGQHLLLIGAGSLMLLWYAAFLWFFDVLPFRHGNPQSYELMEDRVRVVYRKEFTVTIHFSEIARLRLWDAKTNALRSFPYRVLDPLGGLEGTEPLTPRAWWRNVLPTFVPPYSFGLGSPKGEIHIRLNAGYIFLRLIFPWLNTPLRSNVLSLHPADAKEFCIQLEVALLKWWKKQV